MDEFKELISELKDEYKAYIEEWDEKSLGEFEENLYLYIKKNKLSDISQDKESIEKRLRNVSFALIKCYLENESKNHITDSNFEKIVRISSEGYNIALSIINKENVNFNGNYKEKINEMIELLEKVKPYNREEAKRLVSDGILDWNFVNNSKTDTFSLRLWHLMDKVENNCELER